MQPSCYDDFDIVRVNARWFAPFHIVVQ